MAELAPEGVSVHFARMVARGPVGTWDNLQQRAAGFRAAAKRQSSNSE